MSERLIVEAPAGAVPYASLEELKAEHSTLLRRRRDGFQDDPSVFLDEVESFLQRGYATGVVLGDEAERYAAQSLLTYWSNILYREGREVPEVSLTDFDPATAPELVDAECPYLGMDQLAEGQPVRSSGWHRLMDECVNALKQDRFLAIVGASGSGRFTLIHGGVLPALRKGALQGSDEWRYPPPLVLGASPLSDLLRHLNPKADPAWIEAHAAALREQPERVVGMRDETDVQPAVLIVEQFDELFHRSDKTQSRAFAEALLILAEDVSARHNIILDTRPDNLSLVSALGRFGRVFQRNQVLITFTNPELRRMVEEPAKRIGLKYDDGVVDRLLLDVQGDPAALSLLQFTLLLLWNNRQGNRITHEIYDRFGGGRLAVAGQAEKIFSALSPEQQTAARFLLLKLVRPEGGAGVVCRSVPRSQLYPREGASEAVDEALERLRDGHILVRTDGPQPGEVRFGLVHEAVATAWPRFVEWLDDLRARQRWHLQLRAAAEQWREQGRNVDTLWRGVALQQAEAECERVSAVGEELTDLEQAFLQASQSVETRRTWTRRGLITSAIAGFFIIAWLFNAQREQAAKAKLKAEVAAKQMLANQETRSRQELDLQMAQRSTEDAMRLEESESDLAGGFLWLLEAWEHLQKSGELLKPKGLEYLPADYRLRLGMALRRIPRIAHLLYHEKLETSAVSDDGRYAATVSRDGTVRRWSIADETYEEWRLTEGREQAINSVSLSADGRYVVVCTGAPGASGQAFVYHTIGERPAVLPHEGRVTMAAFPPHSRDPLVATVGESANRKGEIKLWKMGTWDPKLEHKPAKVLEAPGIVKHIAFGLEASRLAFAGKDEKKGEGFCLEWDSTQPGKPPRNYPILAAYRAAYRPTRTANYVAYSADGKQLAVACGEQDDDQSYACLFDVANTDSQMEPGLKTVPSGGPREFLPHGGAVNQVTFSLDGKKVVTASLDGTAKVWVLRGAYFAGPPKTLSHGSSVFAADFSPDGQYVATASRDLRARVWDAETGEPVSAILQHSGSVVGVKFTPDGRQTITQSPDMLRVWDPWSGITPPFLFAVPSIIDHVHFDPKTLRVAAAGHDPMANLYGGWARVWDGTSGKQLTSELPHPRRVTHTALSPNGGQFLVTVCDDSFLRVWNVASGQKTDEVRPVANSQPRFAAFSPDGRWLVTAGGDRVAHRGVAQVWAVSPQGKINLVSRELEHDAPITFAAFSQGGDRLVTVTGDLDVNLGEAKVWEWSGKLSSLDLKDDKGHAHQEAITYAAFSSDGRLLVTTSNDDTARIWEVNSGSLLRDFKRHTADVVFASFSDQGEYVVTTSKDRTAIIWDMNTGTPAAILPHKYPVNHAVFSRDSRYIVTACRDGAALIWTIRSGRLVALRRQPGDARQVGYTGDDHGSTIGILSLKSPTQSGETGTGTVSNSPLPASSEYQVGVGVWDLSPGREPSVEALLRIGKAIAARRIDGEVELVTITPEELNDAWKKSRSPKDVLRPAPTPYEWHDRAAADYEAKGRWSAAIWHLDLLALIQPDLVGTYARRARAYVELGRADSKLKESSLVLALEDLNRVLAAEHNNGRSYVERAQIQFDRKKWDEAVKDFSKAEQLIGGDKQIWMGRADAHMNQPRYKEAIVDYLKALRLDPEDGALHGKLALGYYNLKDWSKAADEYGQAASRLPNHLEFKEHLAAALAQQKKNPQAIVEYEAVAGAYKALWQLENARAAYIKAIALKPERAHEGRLRAELAETLSSLGRRDEAIEQYKESVKIEPAEWTHWRGLAWLRQAMRAWPEAKEAYSQAIKLKPDDGALLQARAWVFRQLKEWEHASQDYETAVKLQPNNAPLWMWLADTYVEAEKLDDASRCLEQAAKLNPSNEIPQLRLATIHLLRRDETSYRATCEGLLHHFEQVNNPRTANNVAWACALAPNAVKDLGRVVRLAKRAVEIQQGNSNYLDTLGAVLYRADDMEGTIEQLSESISPSGSRYSVKSGLTGLFDHLFLAMAYHRSKRVEEAKDLLEEVVQRLDAIEQNKNDPARALVMDLWQKRELDLLRDEALRLIKPKR